MTQVEVQLGLRGLYVPGVTAKRLLTNSAPDRPARRSDGYERSGPYGVSIIKAKTSVITAPQVLPPPPLPSNPVSNPYVHQVRGQVILPPPKAEHSMAMCTAKPSSGVGVTVPKPSVKSWMNKSPPLRAKSSNAKTLSLNPTEPPLNWVGPMSSNRVSWISGNRIWAVWFLSLFFFWCYCGWCVFLNI